MEQSDLEKGFERRFDVVNDNYRARCPFHDERTPSFLVHQHDLVGHCFGCGVGGSVEVLLAKYKGIEVEAARASLGITAVDSLAKSRARRKVPKEIRYYPESWLAPWKKEVHEYVIERGFDVRTIQDAGGLFDPIGSRQVFPHRDGQARLLGCTGRTCINQEPKWYHYWGYDKGQSLYSPFNTDPSRPVLVVEGVFDLLWLHQHGIDNVVAILGSQPTVQQVRQLTSLSTTTILGLDNDDAGQQGSDKLRRALRYSTKVHFVTWPVGSHDWMDLSKEQINDILTNTTNYVQRSIIRHTDTSSREALQQA